MSGLPWRVRFAIVNGIGRAMTAPPHSSFLVAAMGCGFSKIYLITLKHLRPAAVFLPQMEMFVFAHYRGFNDIEATVSFEGNSVGIAIFNFDVLVKPGSRRESLNAFRPQLEKARSYTETPHRHR